MKIMKMSVNYEYLCIYLISCIFYRILLCRQPVLMHMRGELIYRKQKNIGKVHILNLSDVVMLSSLFDIMYKFPRECLPKYVINQSSI